MKKNVMFDQENKLGVTLSTQFFLFGLVQNTETRAQLFKASLA